MSSTVTITDNTKYLPTSWGVASGTTWVPNTIWQPAVTTWPYPSGITTIPLVPSTPTISTPVIPSKDYEDWMRTYGPSEDELEMAEAVSKWRKFFGI